MSAPRVALVTGGSRGLGAAIAKHLASCGHRIALTYRVEKEKAKEVVAAIESDGGEAAAFAAEGTDSRSVRAAVRSVVADFGQIDVLVNNIGKTHDGLAPTLGLEFRDVVMTNLRSTFLFSRALVKPMMRRRWGRIVNVSSMVGRNPGTVGNINYVAAKAAIQSFTKSLALEVASRGITVNAVAPGLVLTDLSRGFLQQKASVVKVIPMGRLCMPEEVAKLIAYLAGDDAGYITGEVIGLTGGSCI